MNFHSITGCGQVAKAPVLFESAKGTRFANVRIIINEPHQDESGKWINDDTTKLCLNAYGIGPVGDALLKNTHLGDTISFMGRVRQRRHGERNEMVNWYIQIERYHRVPSGKAIQEEQEQKPVE